MRILITTDGSDGATTAARTACRILTPADRAIDLLCVAPEYRHRLTGWEESRPARDYRRRIVAETERILKETESALDPGVQTGKRYEMGLAEEVIARESANYDLTVLGARGRGERSESGLGPVANHVVHHAPRSVLIGRALHNPSGLRVLTAVDGSEASRCALDAMAALLDLESAEVFLLHVIETPWIHIGLEREWLLYGDAVHDPIQPELDWNRRLRAEAVRILEEARDRLQPHHPAVQVDIAEGIPWHEIPAEAEKRDCDLIVLGTTGASDLKHCMLGSVSNRTAWDAGCSVLIARPQD